MHELQEFRNEIYESKVFVDNMQEKNGKRNMSSLTSNYLRHSIFSHEVLDNSF